ncbi:MAG TPA: hypothetical protein PLL75_04335 [Candidatus Omnitrophota bacterium]|nr:hypothetical protein [Candidatus Omnitrophota bacterium]HPS36938.1 hypothetical protein [Candidatus Omnitrophota bacterium]
MGIESFPEIESFQKLPREVIIKGASTDFSEADGAKLKGIIINNIGHPIRNIRAQLVIFDKDRVPVMGISTSTDPDHLPQGGIANFFFHLKDLKHEIQGYYLHANWGFDETP